MKMRFIIKVQKIYPFKERMSCLAFQFLSPLIKYWLKNTKMNLCNCRYKPSRFKAPGGFRITRLLVVIKNATACRPSTFYCCEGRSYLKKKNYNYHKWLFVRVKAISSPNFFLPCVFKTTLLFSISCIGQKFP
jgi:hypothetical protein